MRVTKAERRKLIPQFQSKVLVADVWSTPPVLHPYSDLIPRVLDIATRMRVGFYDCLYVALAESESCEMVTADEKLFRNLRKQFPFIILLASIP